MSAFNNNIRGKIFLGYDMVGFLFKTNGAGLDVMV